MAALPILAVVLISFARMDATEAGQPAVATTH